MGTANPATLQPARSLLITATTWTFLTCTQRAHMQPLASTASEPPAHPWHSCPAAHSLEGPSSGKLPSGCRLGVGCSHQQLPKESCSMQPGLYCAVMQPILWFSWKWLYFTSTICPWKSSNTTNAQRENLWQRWVQKRVQADTGSNEEKRLRFVPQKGKGNTPEWEKGLFGNLPSHNSQH